LGSDRPVRFERRRDVRVDRIEELDAAGGRRIERDFRKHQEEKFTTPRAAR
jgi:hypothetical protein